MRIMLVFLACIILCSSAGFVQAKNANVVYSEPHLSLDYSEDIHPYAWAAMRPDPYYDKELTAYNAADDKSLQSFLDLQTHLPANSQQASSLLEVKEDLSVFTSTDRKAHGILKSVGKGLMGAAKFAGKFVLGGGVAGMAVRALGSKGPIGKAASNLQDVQKNPKGWSKVFDKKDLTNPASVALGKFAPVQGDFKKIPEPERSTGNFPGSAHYRRAQWGFRRRRIPYFNPREGFGSANPFRQSNHFFNSPNDMMVTRGKWQAAKHPEIFDLGKVTAHENKLPYGGYSSFHNSRFRSLRGSARDPWASPSADGTFRTAGTRGDSYPRFREVEGAPVRGGSGRLSDGSPLYGAPLSGASGDLFRGGPNMKWDGEKFAPTLHPHFGGISPYIPGLTGQYFNFYGDGDTGGEGAESSAGF